MSIVLSESARKQFKPSKNQRRYKCPYCDYRNIKTELIDHINEKHEDLLPKGYTAARVVFNMINKKDHGSCIVCRKETQWDENKCRYNRLCDSKKCHDEYVRYAHKNTNIEEKLRDPEFQQKMLAGRGISGEYKFTGGYKVSYCGSYEKKLLEFMDKFLHIRPEDIQSPGPVIEYEYNGEIHKWITDQYYIPYNLVFDVKDGGDNPNTREMLEYREKQIAKERAIAKQGKYNYIRLTNNDFEQLILIMMELKMNMDDPNAKPIININETSAAVMGAMPSLYDANNVYIIDYLKPNTFVGKERHHAICRDYMSDIFTIDNGELHHMDLENLIDEAEDINVYQYMGDHISYKDILYMAESDTDFYRILKGNKMVSKHQISNDKDFVKVESFVEYLSSLSECIKATILQEKHNESLSIHESFNDNDIHIPVIKNIIMSEITGVIYCRDIDGVFALNENTGMRTPSYKSKYDIPSSLISIIK